MTNSLTVTPGVSLTCLQTTGGTVRVHHYPDGDQRSEPELKAHIPVHQLPVLGRKLGMDPADIAVLEAMVLCFDGVTVKHEEAPQRYSIKVTQA